MSPMTLREKRGKREALQMSLMKGSIYAFIEKYRWGHSRNFKIDT